MLKKRIIPCLDIREGRTVKGINFKNIRDAGDPVELAAEYAKQGADELVFLDITATIEKRKTIVALVEKVAAAIYIPFTVGGGIRSIEDVSAILHAGADKVGINSSAVENPRLISDLAGRFGSQCVVLAVDTKKVGDDWLVYVKGGTQATTIKTIEWVKQAENRGAGEILLTSMNHDGTKLGFALEITRQVSEIVNLPIIASGGAGNYDHFRRVFEETGAGGALAASVFHYGELTIPGLKAYLKQKNIPIR
jgi:cyclase